MRILILLSLFFSKKKPLGKIRNIDFEQSILLEEKISLQLAILLENQNSSVSPEQLSIGVDTFLSNFGSYKHLVNDDCDSIEIWKRVLNTVQDISQLAGSLYEAATGLPLSRSCSSVSDRQSDLYITPALPKRAETFGGFDERKRNVVLSTLSPGYFSNRDQPEKSRESIVSEMDSGISLTNNLPKTATDADLLKDSNYAALQVSHHLHTLLSIISQQFTVIQSLQSKLSIYRDNPKSVYRHNDQLEELRNLQDRFQEEKTNWQKQVEQKEKEMEEQRNQLKMIQEQTRKDQQDIQEQREQLYRKMEVLSSQGLLISPNVSFPVNPSQSNFAQSDDTSSNLEGEHHTDGGSSNIMERRKERWKTMNGELILLIFIINI